VNRKEIINHVRCNKDIGRTKRTVGTRITHGNDRKTRTIADHDGRRTTSGKTIQQVGGGVQSLSPEARRD